MQTECQLNTGLPCPLTAKFPVWSTVHDNEPSLALASPTPESGNTPVVFGLHNKKRNACHYKFLNLYASQTSVALNDDNTSRSSLACHQASNLQHPFQPFHDGVAITTAVTRKQNSNPIPIARLDIPACGNDGLPDSTPDRGAGLSSRWSSPAPNRSFLLIQREHYVTFLRSWAHVWRRGWASPHKI